MKNLTAAWDAVCDTSRPLDNPSSRWKHDWSTHPKSAQRLSNAVRIFQPRVIVETGTFEGLGTYTMARSAHANGTNARIYTIDYDGDPDVSIPLEDWMELRNFRDENLRRARHDFPSVEITFLNGDSREILPGLLEDRVKEWDFFFQDSMHHASGILDEWRIMRPHAAANAIAVFDDICVDWRKLPSHLGGRTDFCLHFILSYCLSGKWKYRSTADGRSQFWTQRSS